MTVRTIDEIFRDFVTDGVPASGPFNPHKPDIRDTLKALTEGSDNFPDNRVIRLNNADEGTANNIVVTASVAIPAAAYQVLYILNVTQENTGPVTVSGAINRDLVTNISQPVPAGYLTPGMALLCIDTGTELRLLSYGDAEAIQAAAEAAAERAETAADEAESAVGGLLSNYDSRSSVEGANISPLVSYVRTAGYYSAGDGGEALYMRIASEPSHGGKVQSDDGAWWELVTDIANIKMFGAKGDGVQDDHPAIQAAINFAQAVGVGRVRVPNTSAHYLVNSTIINDCSVPLTIEGDGRGLSNIKGGVGVNPVIKIGDLASYSGTAQRVRDLSFNNHLSAVAASIRAEACVLDVFNIKIDGGQSGLSLSEVWSFCISDCSFGNTSGPAIYAETAGTGHNSRITSNGFFGCGSVDQAAAIYIVRSDNVLIEQNQIEGCYSAFEIAGCTAVRVVSNYMEFGHHPFYFGFSVRRNSSVIMEGNWIAGYDTPAYIENIDGLFFRGNTIWQQVIGFGLPSNSSNICIGQNTLLDSGVIDSPPWLPLTLINGWTASATLAVNATSDGLVSIRGEITRSSGSGNQNCAILPPEFRPRTGKRLMALNNTGSVVTVIVSSTDGSVYVEAGGSFSGTVYIDITFLR